MEPPSVIMVSHVAVLSVSTLATRHGEKNNIHQTPRAVVTSWPGKLDCFYRSGRRERRKLTDSHNVPDREEQGGDA